jgi:hypothetical protein
MVVGLVQSILVLEPIRLVKRGLRDNSRRYSGFVIIGYAALPVLSF